MNIRANIVDLQLKAEALELLLIARGVIDKENLAILRKQAEENYLKAKKELREKQWAKVTLGSIIEYSISEFGFLRIEVINISPEPFGFLAGKIIEKVGKLKAYHVGEIYTIAHPSELTIDRMTGAREVLTRD